MSDLSNRLNPDNEVDLGWDYEKLESVIPEEVQEVSLKFNLTDYPDLIKNVTPSIVLDEKTGIEYAHLNSPEASKTKVILHFNPFGNGMDENMQLRALYLQNVFQAFDISSGVSLPLISFSAPSGKFAVKLNRKSRKQISKGDFQQLALTYVDLIERLGYKELLIIGFSQGASTASAVAVVAIKRGLRVSHISIGEPANVIKRTALRTSLDFLHAFDMLDKAIDDSQIIHLKKFYIRNTRKNFTRNLIKNSRTNFSIARGLSRDTFESDLSELVNHDVKITIGWSGLNKLCPPETIKRIIESSRKKSENAQIHTVEISNIGHVWADRLNLLATFYAYALSR